MSSFQNKILLCIHYRSGLCVPWECRTVGAPWAVTRPCTRARWSAGQGSPPPAHSTGSRSCTPQFTSTVYSTPGGIQLTVQAHVPAHHSTPVQYTVHQGVYSPQYRLTFLHTTVHQWGIISFECTCYQSWVWRQFSAPTNYGMSCPSPVLLWKMHWNDSNSSPMYCRMEKGKHLCRSYLWQFW